MDKKTIEKILKGQLEEEKTMLADNWYGRKEHMVALAVLEDLARHFGLDELKEEIDEELYKVENI